MNKKRIRVKGIFFSAIGESADIIATDGGLYRTSKVVRYFRAGGQMEIETLNSIYATF